MGDTKVPSAFPPIPWSIRMAPRTLEECAGNSLTRERLLRYTGAENLIFIGRSSAGKSTWAYLALQNVLKPYLERNMRWEDLVYCPSIVDKLDQANSSGTAGGVISKHISGHNASDDALTYASSSTSDGLIQFVSRRVAWPDMMQETTRYILLDNADCLHEEIQNTLCKIDENETYNVSFVLCCHDISLLRADLVSRCAHIHLAMPSYEETWIWLKQVLPSTIYELIQDDKHAQELVKAQYDNGMGQVIHTLHMYVASGGRLLAESLSSEPSLELVVNLVEHLRRGHLVKALIVFHTELWAKGYRAAEILTCAARVCANNTQELSIIADAYKDMLLGQDSQLDVANVWTRFITTPV
jgi:hypothetical protein